jgi:hypothetical protein
VKRSLGITREAMRGVFFQRCFYLFVTLLALISLVPFAPPSPGGIMLRNVMNALVILCAVAAVGRSLTSFIFVFALALPALGARWLWIQSGEQMFFDVALRFDIAVYAAASLLLLRYVFSEEVMSGDRLWGAAASYLMIGVLWAFLYAVIDRESAGSFAMHGKVTALSMSDLIYFSFSTLSTTGFGDIAPLTRGARTGAVIEVIVGQLFLAILIAKLVGIYPEPSIKSTLVREGSPAGRTTDDVAVALPTAHTSP